MKLTHKNESMMFAARCVTGIYYVDMRREEFGDWMVVAILPHNTMVLEIRKPKSDLLPEIVAHSERAIKRSACRK